MTDQPALSPTIYAMQFARIAYTLAQGYDLNALVQYQRMVSEQEDAGAFDQPLIEEMWRACEIVNQLRLARYHEREAWIAQALAEAHEADHERWEKANAIDIKPDHDDTCVCLECRQYRRRHMIAAPLTQLAKTLKG